MKNWKDFSKFRFNFRGSQPKAAFSQKNYYIFRHGKTLANKEHRYYGKKSVFSAEILPEAVPVIKKLAEYLKAVDQSANFSSPIFRARQTVELVSEVTGKTFVFDNKLSEYSMEINESFNSFKKRIKEFVNNAELSEEENILICTHGSCISGLVNVLLGKRISLLMKYPEPGVLVVIKNGVIEYFDFN